MFVGELGDYFIAKMQEKKHDQASVSKRVGW
jgi:hypothetical protein